MQSNFGGSKCAGRQPICEGNSTVRPKIRKQDKRLSTGIILPA